MDSENIILTDHSHHSCHSW